MDFYGDIDLRNNEIQKLVFEQESSFPADAVVGSVVFNDKKLYMAVALNTTNPIWIPLTQSINTYIHEQPIATTAWTVTHNLGTEHVIVQCYDVNRKLIIPDSVSTDSNLALTMNFSTAISGRAIVMYGDEIPANGIGIIEPSNDWSVEFASYDNVSFDISPWFNNATDIRFTSDGTRMFIINSSASFIRGFALSTAWDLSTAAPESFLDVTYPALQFSSPTGIYVSPDGTRVYTCDVIDANRIREYILSTPYIVSSGVNSAAVTIQTVDQGPRAIFFKSDGTRAFISGNGNGTTGSFDRLHSIDLSIPWDLTSASLPFINYPITEVGIAFGMSFHVDGTKLFLVGSGGIIQQYSLSTPWDASTLSYDSISHDASSESTGVQGLAFKSDGKKFYLVDGAAARVYQYST